MIIAMIHGVYPSERVGVKIVTAFALDQTVAEKSGVDWWR